MSKFSSNTDALLKEMQQKFLVPLAIDQSHLIETLRLLHPPYADLGQTFKFNLDSVVSMVTLPFVLASASVHNQRFMQISIAERIRADDHPKEGESELEAKARADKTANLTSQQKMKEFVQSSEGIDNIANGICKFLLDAAKVEDFAQASSDLLLQGTSLTWSAFEILARDVFISYLNETPDAINALADIPNLRKKFELQNISIEDIASHGFDLSSSMGSIITNQQHLNDLPTIKSIYSALFPPPCPLIDKLNDRNLWVLSQQRHLIVHQRGIVDEKFRQNTNLNVKIEDRLLVLPRELEEQLKLVQETGGALLAASSGLGPDL